MKTALITGGTSGTGLCIAKGLLHLGWHVIIIGKTEASCRRALNQVPANLQHRLRLLQADLSLRSETLRVSQEALTILNEINAGKLDVLIANAGTISGRFTTEDLNESFAVQCLSPLWLYDALKVSLCSSEKGRMIFTGSMVHRLVVGKNYSTWTKCRGAFTAYCRSKLGVNWLVLALSNENHAVRFYVADPVFVDSRLGNKSTAKWMRLFWPLCAPFGMTPAKASGTFIMLSQAEIPLNGLYWADRKRSKVSSKSEDAELAVKFLNYLRTV